MSICEHNQELLSDFLDGKLDAARSVSLSEHLDVCSECRSEYHALRNTVALLKSAPTPDGAHFQRLALLNLRNATVTDASVSRRLFTGIRLAAATLAAAALAALTIQLSPHVQITEGIVPPQLITTRSNAHTLPTAFELDEMASLHAVHSFAVAAGDAGDQQDTLADANSRIR
jgi:anti-sigma factor RsiW